MQPGHGSGYRISIAKLLDHMGFVQSIKEHRAGVADFLRDRSAF